MQLVHDVPVVVSDLVIRTVRDWNMLDLLDDPSMLSQHVNLVGLECRWVVEEKDTVPLRGVLLDRFGQDEYGRDVARSGEENRDGFFARLCVCKVTQSCQP